MVYKYDKEDDNWIIGQEARFPDGSVINQDNQASKDGFEWHDEPPKEYLEWLKIETDERAI